MVAAALSEQELFEAARALPPGDARQKYLREACGSDAPLARRVAALLDAFHESDGFLESPLGSLAPLLDFDAALTEPPGTIIGRYRLAEVIGEGGMGVVYRAEQLQPVKRQVALKIIKAGMDTRRTIARFDAERQALALMDHPNIARVLDGGTTGKARDAECEVRNQEESDIPHSELRTPHSTGRPYFVMELVAGKPITQFCDDEGLDLRQRLELMIPVCQAIQHAHQKGIIHRDIKPTNVLVAPYDGRPVPKVIDFGIAKAIQARSVSEGPGSAAFTTHGQIIGTLEYMSPEQAELGAIDIDTRTDVYSLGVLLYELLTGTTPFGKQRLKNAGFDELRRIIREEEPETVSKRLAKTRAQGTRGWGLGARVKRQESGDKHKAHFHPSSLIPHPSPPPHPSSFRLHPFLELDWILAKCLEKDRNRRYESAAALGGDIERYLSGEAVQACPPSTTYRLRKYARKHRTALVAASVVAAALITGTAVSLGQAVEANRARRAADTRLTAEQRARRDAEEARREAELQRDRAERERKRAEAERLRAESERLRAESERDRAESNARLAEQQRKLNSEVWEHLINGLARPGKDAEQLHEAAQLFEKLTDLDSADKVDVYRRMGDLLRLNWESKSALAAARLSYSKGLDIDPSNVLLLVRRGDVSFHLHESPKAIEDYTRAIQSGAADKAQLEQLLPLVRRGLAYYRFQEFDAAVADFEASYALFPQPTVIALASGFNPQAPAPWTRPSDHGKRAILKLAETACNAAPMSLDLHRACAVLLVEFGEFEQAESALEKIGGEYDVSIAKLALLRGDVAKHRSICQKLMEQSANLDDATSTLARRPLWTIYLAPSALDDYAAAIRLAQRGLEQQPTAQSARYLMGATLLRAGRPREAIPYLRSVLTTPNDSGGGSYVVPYMIALAHHALGEFSDAKAWLVKARKSQTSYWTLRLSLQILRAEAERLIEGPPEESGKQK